MRRVRLVVAYDGSAFHGFAEQQVTPTVMGVVREALERICRVPLDLTGAGRTDAGVHAWGQVISGDLPDHIEIESLARRLSRLCGPSIVVRSAAWAAPDFDARFSATWRHYRYTVLASPTPVPALAATAWHVPHRLEQWTMQLACDPLIGEHDFTSFCRRPKPTANADADVGVGVTPPSMRRRVLLATWSEIDSDYGPLLRFEIRANAFCHQMVRSIVGTLVDVGLGRRHAGEITTMLARHDRSAAGQVAPAHGLSLWEVGY